MATESYANNAQTTLNGAINNSTTTVVVTSASGFPSSGQYRVVVGSEIMLVTGGQGTTSWTVTRGAEGTTAASHADGSTVTQVLTAGAIDQIRADIVQTGATGSRPAAAKAGILYLPNDGPLLSRDSGAAQALWGPLMPCYDPHAPSWAWQDQGSATLSTAGGVECISCVSGAADGIHARVVSLPAPPYTFTALLSVFGLSSTGLEGGLCLSDGTKYIVFFSQSDRFGVRKFNSTGSFNSDYVFAAGGTDNLMWYRIADDGGAGTGSVTFQISHDGINWTTVYTRDRNNFLTETKIGFYINPNNAGVITGVKGMATLYSWLQG